MQLRERRQSTSCALSLGALVFLPAPFRQCCQENGVLCHLAGQKWLELQLILKALFSFSACATSTPSATSPSLTLASDGPAPGRASRWRDACSAFPGRRCGIQRHSWLTQARKAWSTCHAIRGSTHCDWPPGRRSDNSCTACLRRRYRERVIRGASPTPAVVCVDGLTRRRPRNLHMSGSVAALDSRRQTDADECKEVAYLSLRATRPSVRRIRLPA